MPGPVWNWVSIKFKIARYDWIGTIEKIQQQIGVVQM